ncbi:MAG: hypothetical protein KAS32_04865 [Candidatus Peribacteraceae bacterium]|nr:hypothetical protein [Candidatus Peribacteraceae bacterium]
MKYTKEQKAKYFKELRARWKASKKLADNDKVAQALFQEAPEGVSYHSFYFALQEMKKLGLEGLPYIDCKTYRKWQEAGFQVKKGEKSKLDGIVWLEAETEDEDEEKFVFPKVYHLFHKSQVEEVSI